MGKKGCLCCQKAWNSWMLWTRYENVGYFTETEAWREADLWLIQSTHRFLQIKAQWGKFLLDKHTELKEQLLECHFKAANRYLKLLVPLVPHNHQGVGSSRVVQLCVKLLFVSRDTWKLFFKHAVQPWMVQKDGVVDGGCGGCVPCHNDSKEVDQSCFELEIQGKSWSVPFRVHEGVKMTSEKNVGSGVFLTDRFLPWYKKKNWTTLNKTIFMLLVIPLHH